MAECGNMPDWNPYNGPQGVRGSSQNQNASHMFISSISPGSLDGMNLSTDSRHQSSKHHQGGGGGGGGGVGGNGGGGDGSSYMSRNYPPVIPLPSTNCPTSSPITSAGVHMSGLSSCVSHYTSSATQSRNSMLDSSLDPRMVSGMSEESHRPPQIPFPVAPSHQPTGINVNPGNSLHGNTAMSSQNSPVGSISPGRQAAGFSTCKAPCCNPDAAIPYQHWEKYSHYHGSTTNTSLYRDNLRQSAYPPLDNRRYHPEMNIRKDCLETNKDLEVSSPFPIDHRRTNFSDYKYRKDNVLPRNYPTNAAANLLQNYQMQNYNYPSDYQKCPYSVKDYIRRGNASSSSSSSNSKNSNHFKYQEQQQIAQQKYQKQMQYQNNPIMAPLQNSTSATPSVSTNLQNSYYNTPQVSRDYTRDYQQEQSRIAQASSNSGPHGHGSFQKYQQVYHQKIAMQRYSVENHLRAFARIPGYQSHPKYQECVMRYRDLLRLQQTVDYQNVLQETPKIPSPSNPHVPINLQFDQNGVLINTSYMPPGYTGAIHGTTNPIPSTETSEVPVNSRIATNLEVRNAFPEQTESVIKIGRDLGGTHRNVVPPMQENPERFFMPGDKNPNDTSANDTLLNSIRIEETNKTNERPEIAPSTAITGGETTDSIEYNNSKDFADKPELDVRQFLANWDESEDEENPAANLTEPTDLAPGEFNEAVFNDTIEKNVSSRDNCNDERGNKNDNSILITADTENLTEATNDRENSRLNTDNPSEIMPKHMECVRSEEDDIPTIHIVDSLEEGSEIEKIHTVFGSLATAVLNPIAIGDNSPDDLAKGETIVLFEQSDGICPKTLEFSVEPEGNPSGVVEGVIASIIDSSAVATVDAVEKNEYKSPEAPKSDKNTEESEQTISSASSPTDSSFAASNSVSSTSTSSKSTSNEGTSSLRKQSSFNMDETHNPDDISLPDLQTLECTPISTTLNTPTHSDSEESSEHVTDLTTSTNPIEIIQNSPIISFTHSPIKIEPYEQLENSRIARQDRQREPESLDFDFDRECARRENEKYNETTAETSVDCLERNSGDSMLLEDIREPYEAKNSNEQRQESFYGQTEPLVRITDISGTKDKEKNCNAPSVSPVDNISNDQEMLQRERDFRRTEELEKLCDMSLDGTCMIPLIPEEEEDCEEPRMPVPPMEGNCLTKILNDTLPITNLDFSESSNDEKLQKPEDDVWVDVRYMETDLDDHLREKSDARKIRKERTKNRHRLSRPIKKNDKTRKYVANTSMESEAEERMLCPERENSEEDFTSALTQASSSATERKKDYTEESKKSKDSRKRRISKDAKQTLRVFEDNKIIDTRSDGDSSLALLTSPIKERKEDYIEESRKSRDSRRLFTEDELEDDELPDERSNTDTNFLSTETLESISKKHKDDYSVESKKSKDSRRRRSFTDDELEDDKRLEVTSSRDENFSSMETFESISKETKDSSFEESRKSKGSRRRRVSRETILEYSKIMDGRSERDENSTSTNARERKDDYSEKPRKSKDSRMRRASGEYNVEYDIMADARSDEEENFPSAEISKAKEPKEEYFGKSKQSKNFRRRRVSKEDQLDGTEVKVARSEEDENFETSEPKFIAKEQKEDYYEESRKLKDSRRRRISKDDKQTLEEFDDDQIADGKSTTTFQSKHRDSNLEIHVANVNFKIQDNEISRKKDCAIMKTNKSQDSSDSVDAIEIKINLSRGDTRRGGKFVEDDLPDSLELLEGNNQREDWAARKIRCRKRRRSLPESFECVKRARKNDDDRQQPQFSYTAKKIKNRNRHKTRKSMEDELLINYERMRKENIAEDRNFHLEMAKTFNLPWPREKINENENSDSISVKNIGEEDKKVVSRNDKHTFNGRTVPSPSYNSSVDSTMDFDKFDVAPHNSSDTEPEPPETMINEARYTKRKMRLEDRERYRNPTNYSNTDEMASLDAFELNLNTVPIYTTKDGRITYSPNRNYTYRTLIMEARQREGYPPLRRLHYPSKQLIRNQRHESNNQRGRTFKKWWEDERIENKRRSIDGGKSKRSRTHYEEAENRTRTKKYDNRRNDTRISTDNEHESDEQSRNYSVDFSVGQNRTSDFISGSSKTETIINQPEIESVPRRADILRLDDTDLKNSTTSFKGGGKIVDLDDFRVGDDGNNIANTFGDREDKDTIVSKIYQGQELEIARKKPEKNCCERLESGRNSRFFRDSRLWLKTPMASPLVNPEKRPGWDIEQDCQTLLSDSGLESSTTYVEASKDSSRRIIQRWADNSFGNKVEISRSNEYETVVQEKTQETERFLEPEKQIIIEDHTETTEIHENPVEVDDRGISPIIPNEETEIINEKVIVTKPKLTLELRSSIENNRMSEIVKSLDLAIVNRVPAFFKEVRRENEAPRERTNETKMPAKIFQRDKEVKKFTNKDSETLTRRASSGDAESRESRNLFFRETKIETIEEKTEVPSQFLEDEEETMVEHNQDTGTTHNEALNISKSPEHFDNACKDFLIDTSTSFSSCLRLRVPEPLSDLPTESEASRLEDTATRFASESMDFKEISRDNKDFTFNRDANSGNDENNCKHSFLSTITENAVASDDCSRESGEISKYQNSPGKSPEKAPILSFSGQIRDSRHEESASKSPPCLMSEVSLPQMTNIRPKSSPQHSPKMTAEGDDKKTQDFEDSLSSQPKIPKMIIRNVKSRPATPTIEEAQESTRESNLFEVEMKLNETIEDSKIPKMKIKLEDKPKIRDNQETIFESTKNVPRVKIKKVRRSSTSRSPMRTEKLPLVGRLSRDPSESEITVDLGENLDNSNASSSYKFTLLEKIPEKNGEKVEEDIKLDRIPKLTIKKQEVSGSGSPSGSLTAKKRQSRSPGESGSRKKKCTSRHGSQKKEETRSQERKKESSLDIDSNTDSQSLSEKVPKVIIKRTSPSAEFKCELSKEGRDAIIKDSKWQPEVKLQRSWVLDCMAKEPGGVKVALKMLEGVMARKERMQLLVKDSREWKGSISDCDIERTSKTSANLVTGNNRRKSFEEFVNNYRRLSREKAELRQKHFVDSMKIEAIARKPDSRKEISNYKKPENIASDKNTRIYDENSGEVIKLDSSDESQTTIEILPASMDNSQTDMENIIMADGNLSKLYSDEAIPTQFELELEIVDNSTVDSLDVPIPLPTDTSHEDDSTSTIENISKIERFEPCTITTTDDDGSIATDLGCGKFSYPDNTIVTPKTNRSESLCCSDSLVKKVLAAKETLKRCFINSKSMSRTKLKPRTKTAAEKKQGFHFVSLAGGESTSKCERVVFQDEEKHNTVVDNSMRSEKNSKTKVKEEKSYSSRDKKSSSDKKSKEHSSSLGKSSKRSSNASFSSSSSSSGISRSSHKSNNHGENSKSKNNGNIDKTTKHRNNGKSSEKSTDVNAAKSGKIEDSSSGLMKSYKIPKISKSRDVKDQTMKQEIRSTPSPTKVMPVLEPQDRLNFELTGSDRDTSRSPPVITKHEERDIPNVLPKIIEDKTLSDKLDITKQDTEAVTFADIVSQLAYHEKATIRHRRYCTLCERWFPTAARHRRHLTGYQHRHTELTQRRTVHALFMLFTGKPCPRLLPASIVRTDCLPGEPTPLQIAVQDVAISLEDGARLKSNDVISEKDD